MSKFDMLSSLSMATLVIALLIAGIAFALFLSRRSNRKGMEGYRERNIAEDIDAGNEAPAHSPPGNSGSDHTPRS